jgi:hypothetical protein
MYKHRNLVEKVHHNIKIGFEEEEEEKWSWLVHSSYHLG